MAIKAKHIIKWLIQLGLIYLSTYWLYFLTYDADHSNVAINVIGLLLSAICAFVFGYGLISLIHDFRSGGMRVIIEKIKMLWRG